MTGRVSNPDQSDGLTDGDMSCEGGVSRLTHIHMKMYHL